MSESCFARYIIVRVVVTNTAALKVLRFMTV